jgi:hypothetical protein
VFETATFFPAAFSACQSFYLCFPNARLTRSKTGVLEVALHTNGGTLAFKSHRAAGKGVSQPSSFPARQDAVPAHGEAPGPPF